MEISKELEDLVIKTSEKAIEEGQDNIVSRFRLFKERRKCAAALIVFHEWNGFGYKKSAKALKVKLGFASLTFYNRDIEAELFDGEFHAIVKSHVSSMFQERKPIKLHLSETCEKSTKTPKKK